MTSARLLLLGSVLLPLVGCDLDDCGAAGPEAECEHVVGLAYYREGHCVGPMPSYVGCFILEYGLDTDDKACYVSPKEYGVVRGIHGSNLGDLLVAEGWTEMSCDGLWEWCD